MLLNERPLDSQSVYGCNVFWTKWALLHWNYLSLLKVRNFRKHLWLTKRKTKWQAAGNVGFCPPVPPCAIDIYDHVLSTFWLVLVQNVLALAASNAGSQAHSNAVHWTATSVTIVKYLQNFCLLVQILFSWKHTNVSAHWTEFTLPVRRQVASSLQNCSTSIAYRVVSGVTRLIKQYLTLLY
jgi:hypothetical protein